MNNTLRVLGIIGLAMLLGLTSLVLLLFAICGGFEEGPAVAATVLSVSFVIIFGGGAAIVWLGRGITPSRPHAGLAVPPAGYAQAPAAPAAPVRREALTGGSLQLLIVLRVVLALYILASLGMTAWTFSYLSDVTLFTALRFAVPGFINVLPAALALLLLSFNPPSGGALDLAAGTSIASLVWRTISFARFMLNAYGAVMSLPFYVLQMALFTLADVAIVGLSLAVRRKVETGNYWRIVVAAFAFLVWEWFLQMAMMLLY
jgi:hypothetical protein